MLNNWQNTQYINIMSGRSASDHGFPLIAKENNQFVVSFFDDTTDDASRNTNILISELIPILSGRRIINIA